MKLAVGALLALLFCGHVCADAVAVATSPLLEALERQVAASDDKAVRRFWKHVAREHAPLVEAGSTPQTMRVTFLWRASPAHAGSSVAISGAFLIPLGLRVERLRQLGASDIWYRTYELPRAARFSITSLSLKEKRQRRWRTGARNSRA